MNPVNQTYLTSEDGSTRGNCMSACLASMLELDINKVPHFAAMHEDEWSDAFHQFLYENGCRFMGTIFTEEEVKDYKGIDGYVMVAGKSPRTFAKNGHAVIYKDGKFFFDPHPSKEGIVEFEFGYMIERIN